MATSWHAQPQYGPSRTRDVLLSGSSSEESPLSYQLVIVCIAWQGNVALSILQLSELSWSCMFPGIHRPLSRFLNFMSFPWAFRFCMSVKGKFLELPHPSYTFPTISLLFAKFLFSRDFSLFFSFLSLIHQAFSYGKWKDNHFHFILTTLLMLVRISKN